MTDLRVNCSISIRETINELKNHTFIGNRCANIRQLIRMWLNVLAVWWGIWELLHGDTRYFFLLIECTGIFVVMEDIEETVLDRFCGRVTLNDGMEKVNRHGTVKPPRFRLVIQWNKCSRGEKELDSMEIKI